jgi:hypothetical protein
VTLEYVGYRKHIPGRIHLYCPGCGYKVSNVPRAEYDPPTAVLAHLPCERCSAGCKVDGPSLYLDARGKRVEWDIGLSPARASRYHEEGGLGS